MAEQADGGWINEDGAFGCVKSEWPADKYGWARAFYALLPKLYCAYFGDVERTNLDGKTHVKMKGAGLGGNEHTLGWTVFERLLRGQLSELLPTKPTFLSALFGIGAVGSPWEYMLSLRRDGYGSATKVPLGPFGGDFVFLLEPDVLKQALLEQQVSANCENQLSLLCFRGKVKRIEMNLLGAQKFNLF
mgnify:CR=1 FL=1